MKYPDGSMIIPHEVEAFSNGIYIFLAHFTHRSMWKACEITPTLTRINWRLYYISVRKYCTVKLIIRMLRTPGTRLRSHQKNCWQFGALVHLSCPDLGCHYKMSHGVASEKYCKHRFYLVENKVEDALIVYCNSSDIF
jgi:hypothetical protein